MHRQINLHLSHLSKVIKIPTSILFYQDCFWILLWVHCLSCTAELWACQGSYWLKSVLRLSFISSVWDVVEFAFWMTYGGACELFEIKSRACGQKGCMAFWTDCLKVPSTYLSVCLSHVKYTYLNLYLTNFTEDRRWMHRLTVYVTCHNCQKNSQKMKGLITNISFHSFEKSSFKNQRESREHKTCLCWQSSSVGHEGGGTRQSGFAVLMLSLRTAFISRTIQHLCRGRTPLHCMPAQMKWLAGNGMADFTALVPKTCSLHTARQGQMQLRDANGLLWCLMDFMKQERKITMITECFFSPMRR